MLSSCLKGRNDTNKSWGKVEALAVAENKKLDGEWFTELLRL